MAKFFGKVGFYIGTEETVVTNDEDEEVGTGIYNDVLDEKSYAGDIIRDSKQWNTSSEKVNDDLSLNNRISIVADNFAYENLSAIRYVEWNGVFWRVSSIEIQRPRLILSLGGVYNGPTFVAPETPS